MFFFLLFFFLPEFAFPWCMMDGQRSSCCSNWHIWSLQLTFSFFPHQPSLAENEFCFLLNGSCESSLSLFFLIRRVAALSVNSLGTIIDLHEKCMTDNFLVSLSHEIFPDTFFFFFFSWLRTHFLLHDWPRSVLRLVKIDCCCLFFFSFICIYSAYRFHHIIHLSMEFNRFRPGSQWSRISVVMTSACRRRRILITRPAVEQSRSIARAEDPIEMYFFVATTSLGTESCSSCSFPCTWCHTCEEHPSAGWSASGFAPSPAAYSAVDSCFRGLDHWNLKKQNTFCKLTIY